MRGGIKGALMRKAFLESPHYRARPSLLVDEEMAEGRDRRHPGRVAGEIFAMWWREARAWNKWIARDFHRGATDSLTRIVLTYTVFRCRGYQAQMLRIARTKAL